MFYYDCLEVMNMATAKANVNVRIDANVKERATQLFGRMGIDQTTAIDMFYRQTIAENRLPFQPAVTSTQDESVLEALLRRGTPRVTLEADENGNAVIDKDEHPDIYDWLVNG